MAIKTTRIKSTQAPRVETLDLSSQLNGSRQTFSLPRDIHRYDRHYLVWNSTVYRNDANHRFYSISGDGKTLTTYFDEAPKGGPGYTLQLAVDMSGDGDDETVSQTEFEEAVNKINADILAEGTTRADQDAVLQEHIDAEATARTEADDAINAQISALKAASDVSDVVDTYADLEAYDKSTLTENDIVKVLNDSTHDGKQSYYRLVNNEWQWVASVSNQDDRLTDSGATRANSLSENVLDSFDWTRDMTGYKLTFGIKNLDNSSRSVSRLNLAVADDNFPGLMDFTDKTKLNRVPQTIVSAAGIRRTSDDGKTSILVKYKNTATGQAYDDVVEIPLVSAQYNGLMSIADKSKLDSIDGSSVKAPAYIYGTAESGQNKIFIKGTASGGGYPQGEDFLVGNIEKYDSSTGEKEIFGAEICIPIMKPNPYGGYAVPLAGAMSQADKLRLDSLATIKTIGTGLALSADGELSSTNSDGLTEVPIATDTVVGGIKSSSASKGIRVDAGGYSWGPYVYDMRFNQYSTGPYLGELCLAFDRANSTAGVTKNIITVPTATAGSNGAMSKEDKTKLDGLASIKAIGDGLTLSDTGELIATPAATTGPKVEILHNGAIESSLEYAETTGAMYLIGVYGGAEIPNQKLTIKVTIPGTIVENVPFTETISFGDTTPLSYNKSVFVPATGKLSITCGSANIPTYMMVQRIGA